MTRLGDMLEARRRELGFSYKKLEDLAGVSAVYISQTLRGKRIPRDEVLVRLAKALDLDPALVLRLAHYEKAPESARRYLGFREDEHFENISPYPLGTAQRIPVLGWVQAGKFAPSETVDLTPENPDDYVYSDIKGRNLFALRVENDSMEPVFHPGDIIIINPNIEPNNGDYVIVRLKDPGEVTFKKLLLKDELVILRPLNPRYEDIILSRKEKFEIIGKVVERKTIF